MAPDQRNSGKADYFQSHSMPRKNPAWLTYDVLIALRDKGVAIKPLLPFYDELPEAAQFELSFRDTAAVFERASHVCSDPLFGFHMGQRRDFRSMGLVAYAAQSSETLSAFLHSFTRNMPLYSEVIDIALTQDGRMRWQILEPASLGHHQYLEFLVTLVFKAARNSLDGGGLLLPHRISASFDGQSGEQEAFWGVKLSESAPSFVEIEFRKSDLNRPLRSADPYLARLIAEFAAVKHKELIAEATTLPRRVEHLIHRHLTRSDLSQAFIAAELDMSSRTLARELGKNDLRFFEILDEMRCRWARWYLRDSTLELKSIAAALGYASVSSFSDAFKRWTQQTPGAFRQMYLLTDSPD